MTSRLVGGCVLNSDVTVRSVDGSVAQTQGEVVSAIHSYWTSFWVQAEAENPSVTQRTDALRWFALPLFCLGVVLLVLSCSRRLAKGGGRRPSQLVWA